MFLNTDAAWPIAIHSKSPRRSGLPGPVSPTVSTNASCVRFSGSADNDFRIAHHDANGVKFMPVQLYGIVRCDFDFVHVYVIVVQCKMMMRLGSQRNNGGHLREDHQGKTTHCE